MIFKNWFESIRKYFHRVRLARRKASEIEVNYKIVLSETEKEFIRYYYMSEQKSFIPSVGNFVFFKWDEDDRGTWKRLIILKTQKFILELSNVEEEINLEKWGKQAPIIFEDLVRDFIINFDSIFLKLNEKFNSEIIRLGRDIDRYTADELKILSVDFNKQENDVIFGILSFKYINRKNNVWRFFFDEKFNFYSLACIEK